MVRIGNLMLLVVGLLCFPIGLVALHEGGETGGGLVIVAGAIIIAGYLISSAMMHRK